MKRLLSAAACLAVLFGIAYAEVTAREYTLFGGSDTDSTEQLSAWVPVGGAKRVYLRTWSTHALWHISTDTDSAFSDTISSIAVQFSDSISAQVTGPEGRLISVAADSIVLGVSHGSAVADTAKAMISAWQLPVTKQLRAPGNGSGLVTVIYPIQPIDAAASTASFLAPDASGMINKRYMRIRITPLRRSRSTSWDATVPARVNGLKGLRMKATVVTETR